MGKFCIFLYNDVWKSYSVLGAVYMKIRGIIWIRNTKCVLKYELWLFKLLSSFQSVNSRAENSPCDQPLTFDTFHSSQITRFNRIPTHIALNHDSLYTGIKLLLWNSRVFRLIFLTFLAESGSVPVSPLPCMPPTPSCAFVCNTGPVAKEPS